MSDIIYILCAIAFMWSLLVYLRIDDYLARLVPKNYEFQTFVIIYGLLYFIGVENGIFSRDLENFSKNIQEFALGLRLLLGINLAIFMTWRGGRMIILSIILLIIIVILYDYICINI